MNVQPTRVSSSDSVSGVQSQTNDQESISIKNVQPSRVDSTDVSRTNVLFREMKTQPSLKLFASSTTTMSQDAQQPASRSPPMSSELEIERPLQQLTLSRTLINDSSEDDHFEIAQPKLSIRSTSSLQHDTALQNLSQEKQRFTSPLSLQHDTTLQNLSQEKSILPSTSTNNNVT